MADEDFLQEAQEDWNLLRGSTLTVVSDRASDLKSQLEIASAETAWELSQYVKKLGGITPEVLGDVVAKAVQTFLAKFYNLYRKQSLAGLIELVLEGQDLTPEELQGFVRALPNSLIQRILLASTASTTGIHALLAIEDAHRNKRIQEYSLGRDGPRTTCTFYDPVRKATVTFYLDEKFEISG